MYTSQLYSRGPFSIGGLSRPHPPPIGAKDIISNTGIPAPALAISWRDGHECLLQSPVLAMHDSARLVVPRRRAQRLPKQAWAIAIAVRTSDLSVNLGGLQVFFRMSTTGNAQLSHSLGSSNSGHREKGPGSRAAASTSGGTARSHQDFPERGILRSSVPSKTSTPPARQTLLSEGRSTLLLPSPG
jgi:hypothetical protein